MTPSVSEFGVNQIALDILDDTIFWLGNSTYPWFRTPIFQALHKGYFMGGERRYIFSYRWPTQSGYYVYLASGLAEKSTPDNPVIYMEWRGKGITKKSVLERTNIHGRPTMYYFDRMFYSEAYRRAVLKKDGRLARS